MAKTLKENNKVGSCTVCGLQYTGRVHSCPGELEHVHHDLDGTLFLDEIPGEHARLYGERLDDGFDLLSDSDWGETHYEG
jgi:hypothetical protein